MKAVPGHKAVLAIMALSLTRFRRSRVLWVAIFFAAIPLLPLAFGAGADESPEYNWENFYGLAALFQTLIGCLLMAPVIAEEIENKTYAYLWSRPIPRWSVLLGKLAASWLLCALVFAGQLAIGYNETGLSDPTALAKALAGSLVALATVGATASALGIFGHKHPLPISMGYFLILDLGIGAAPFSGARVSVMHNMGALAGFGPNADTPAVSIAWLLGLALFWLALANSRLQRKEMSTGS